MISLPSRYAAIVAVPLIAWLIATAAVSTPSHPVPTESPSPSESPEHLTARQRRERDPRIAIPNVMRLQERAWNHGDIKTFMTGYLNSPETTYTSGGTIVRGYDALLGRYQARYGNDRKTMGTLRFEKLQITPLGKDYALCVGQWFLELGGKHGPMDGVFTLLWQRTGDGWKILHDHTSQRTQ